MVEKGEMGFFGGFLGAGYQTTEVSCDAIIIDMHTGKRVVSLTGDAQGTSGGIGLGYGVFVFAGEEGSIEHALAEKIVETLLLHSQKNKVHITVFGIGKLPPEPDVKQSDAPDSVI